MVELQRRIRMRVLAAGAVGLLAAVTLAGCGGSGSGRARSGTSAPPASETSPGSTSSGSPTTPGGSTGSGSATTPGTGNLGSLAISPTQPTTRSELTFTFTAPVASGVHGTHVISYSLSLVGPQRAGCVNAHEAAAPRVPAGPGARIVVGPSELHAPWCAGQYVARLLELASAHCTGTAPCPQYVRVVGLVGRRTFTVRRS